MVSGDLVKPPPLQYILKNRVQHYCEVYEKGQSPNGQSYYGSITIFEEIPLLDLETSGSRTESTA